MKTQVDQRDCSLYVLDYFHEFFYKENLDINNLKLQIQYSAAGISLENIKLLASKVNLELNAYEINCEQLFLLEKQVFPIATVIKNNTSDHMIVIRKIKNNKFYIYDPIDGDVKLSKNEFKTKFTNIIVAFSKNKKQIDNEDEENKKNIKPNPLISNSWSLKISLWSNFSFLYLFCLLIEISIYISFPFLNKVILNNIALNKDDQILMFLGMIFSVLFLINFTFNLLTRQLMYKIATKYKSDLINNLINELKFKNKQVINLLTFSDFKNRIIALDNLSLFKLCFLPELISTVISIAVSFILLININWVLLLIIFCYSVITLILSFINKTNFDNNFNKLLNNSIMFEDTLFNIYKLNQTSHNENLLNNLNLKSTYVNEKLHSDSIIFKNKQSLINYLSLFLDFLVPLLILIIGTIQIWNQNLSVINLIFFLTGVSLFTKPIKNIIPLINSYSQYKKDLDLISLLNFEDLKIPKTSLQNERIIKIQLSNISYSYNSLKVNKDLEIKKLLIDSSIHLVGKNGSGKSTLCSILNGSCESLSGIIKVNDQKLNPFLDETYKQRVLYISNQMLNLKIRTLEYLCVTDISIFKSILENNKLDKLIDELNINLNSSLDQLSSGQVQFVNLLNIFLNDYDLLILDEAFANIDKSMFEKLKPIIKNNLQNKLVVEISHNNRYIFDDSKEVNIENLS
ncbi:cysteine peptidase family C39 domain-containing protein [Mycoplasma sp. 2704]|uniref:Mbov_0121 family peptidase domain-containing ABC transporter n=1 Tax=unclassified Mycoplasma TaxID=2683645 RepID=UPI002B1E8307|nr:MULTISPECIES: cysteine peptidase family C39 domain-containing protein [unclassified Mycoplasma]MEA4134226.1 cysteine peptidase family C39 domain-containing protein [Mycoplasma sp. 2704]MEA4333548.1 cysteine peptidase family C39 domain-containing protein [Mycoplasma sp. 1232]